jgi:hypothetical protein
MRGSILRIYAEIWKAAAPADLIDVEVLCVSDERALGPQRSSLDSEHTSVRH